MIVFTHTTKIHVLFIRTPKMFVFVLLQKTAGKYNKSSYDSKF